ncbi:Ger(x)C family spore germination protein [Ammoniphilus sp. 3BR4]|uniref:Ger(x)C family spore germination protein n=1 Tax=Ammoniphilus sp. 3BR4 TaxID=3158265 RepID=UPI0034666C24
MRKTAYLLSLAMICIMFLTGCWNRRELDQLAISLAMGIDKEGDQYVVTHQVVNPSEVASSKGGGGGTATPVTMYQGKGKTVFEASRRVTKIVPRKIYAAHIRVLVIGEEFAKEGLAKALDFISRGQEFRTDFYIVLAKGGKAADALKVLTPLEKIPANNIFEILETSEKAWAAAGTVQLDKLISDLVSKGKEPAITGIRINGNPEEGSKPANLESTDVPTRVTVSDIAVLKDGKLVGWLSEPESKVYNYIIGNVFSTVISLPCPKRTNKQEEFAYEVIRTKENVKARIDEGKPIIEVKIEAEGSLAEVECAQLDLSKTETVRQLEKQLNDQMEQEIKTVVKAVQKKYKADIFGFGEVVHRENPDYWKKVKNDWEKIFTKIEIRGKADFKIRRTGTVGDSFLNELEKEK